MRRRPFTPSIPTVQSIRRTRARLNRRRRRLYEVLRAMHHGAVLRLHDDGWALITGMLVDADIANMVIAGPRIAPVDYALFAETPAQTWRWVGTDLLCVK